MREPTPRGTWTERFQQATLPIGVALLVVWCLYIAYALSVPSEPAGLALVVAAFGIGSAALQIVNGHNYRRAAAMKPARTPPGTRERSRDADGFDRFTDGARRVLTLSQDEAQRLNHDYIGTEHVLAGLVRQDGRAAQTLAALNVTLTTLRDATAALIARGERPVVGEVGLTESARRTIASAIREAAERGDGHIGPEHVLLGLLREADGGAARILAHLRVEGEHARTALLESIDRPGGNGD